MVYTFGPHWCYLHLLGHMSHDYMATFIINMVCILTTGTYVYYYEIGVWKKSSQHNLPQGVLTLGLLPMVG